MNPVVNSFRRLRSGIRRYGPVGVVIEAGRRVVIQAVGRPGAGGLGEVRDGRLRFICNICGQICEPRREEVTRENPTCERCHSNLRYRAVIHVLALQLFGKGLPLPQFPHCPDLVGMGLSDWSGYADRLAGKLSYRNTFLDKEPRLDIAAISESLQGTLDFLVSSDVFEHVAPPVSRAFVNARRLLKPGGVLVLTVPYSLETGTREHFPALYEYSVERIEGVPVLKNRTRDGRLQEYRDLVFHGGDGETLEMRVFSENSVLEELAAAGFRDVHIHREPELRFGIVWDSPWSLPISAIAQS